MISSDEALCGLFEQTRNQLCGPQRRHFMGKVVNAIGDGGQPWAESILGWSRTTIRKAQRELANNFTPIEDQVHSRGRKDIENHIPTLCDDIRKIADRNSCQDPTFDTTQVYCRLSAKSVRYELLSTYPDDQLPSERTIRTKLNQLDFPPTKVAKSKPTRSSSKSTRSMPKLIKAKGHYVFPWIPKLQLRLVLIPEAVAAGGNTRPSIMTSNQNWY